MLNRAFVTMESHVPAFGDTYADAPGARPASAAAGSAHQPRRRQANAEDKLRLQVQTARLEADASARIRFESIDKDNFLLIVAPVDGVITDVTSTQPGDKNQANAPLGGIAPKNARPILKIEIAEHDRAFLREGLPVQMKFKAFPYQRYRVTGDQAVAAGQAAGVRRPGHAGAGQVTLLQWIFTSANR